MLPTKADTLKLPKSVFLQTSPAENINQPLGGLWLGGSGGIELGTKFLFKYFFQIFFLNLILFIEKEGKIEKTGLE